MSPFPTPWHYRGMKPIITINAKAIITATYQLLYIFHLSHAPNSVSSMLYNKPSPGGRIHKAMCLVPLDNNWFDW